MQIERAFHCSHPKKLRIKHWFSSRKRMQKKDLKIAIIGFVMLIAGLIISALAFPFFIGYLVVILIIWLIMVVIVLLFFSK